MTDTDLFHDQFYVEPKTTPLTENQAAIYLKNAFTKIIGKTPKVQSIAILWAQCALETGRYKKLFNNNYGNIKAVIPAKAPFTMMATGENLYNKETGKVEYKWFTPPSSVTAFVANPDAQIGAEHYVNFLANRQRYAKSWAQVIAGNSDQYVIELKNASYFTASLEAYKKTVNALTGYFVQHANDLLKDLTPETQNTPAAQSSDISSILSQEDKDHIMSLVTLTNHNSIEDYFFYSNNDNEDQSVA
jgi:hypothetical protein